jgi:hypothetical protein
MRVKLYVFLLGALNTSCLHFPIADEKCDLQCYGVEVIDDKWCVGIFNYNKCNDQEASNK